MQKTYENGKEKVNMIDFDTNQKFPGFTKSVKINVQPAEVNIKPEEAIDVHQKAFLELEQFKRSKVKIQKVINESKIKIGGKYKAPIKAQRQQIYFGKKIQQEEQYIPCPFCAKPLLLIDLGHIQTCEQGNKCSYCEEKYPVSLFAAHRQVCQSRPRPNYIVKKQFQFQNKRVATQTRQNFFKQSSGMFGKNPLNKKSFDENKINKYTQLRNNLGIEHQNSLQRLTSYRRMQTQFIPSIQDREHIRQIPQAPINYAEYFDKKSKLRAEKQKGISKRELQSLRREIWNGAEGDCVICSQDYRPKTRVINLPCSHIFHEDCLLPWLQSSRRCPTCRKQM